jgi:hypothetical protein
MNRGPYLLSLEGHKKKKQNFRQLEDVVQPGAAGNTSSPGRVHRPTEGWAVSGFMLVEVGTWVRAVPANAQPHSWARGLPMGDCWGLTEGAAFAASRTEKLSRHKSRKDTLSPLSIFCLEKIQKAFSSLKN